MTTKTTYVLVGLFVLLLTMTFVGAVLWLTTGGPPKDYDFYVVYMTESVSGLNVDAPVQYKGVNVGRVREIVLDPEDPERVRVLLVVLEGTPVKTDTVATLAVQGLTGIASIDLSGGSRQASLLEPGDDEDYAVIPSAPSLLVRLDQTVSELLDNLIETSARLNQLMNDGNQEAFGDVLRNTRDLSANLVERADEISLLVSEATELTRNARIASVQLPQMVDQFTSAAGTLEEMAVSLADAGRTLQASSVELEKTVTESGRDVRMFTANTLPEASNLIVELRDAAVSLRRLSQALEEDPQQLVFGGPPPTKGPGE